MRTGKNINCGGKNEDTEENGEGWGGGGRKGGEVGRTRK